MTAHFYRGALRNSAHTFQGRTAEYKTFLREFLHDPNVTGAILPSSDSLASAMLEPIDFARVSAIAELGPGTGSLTKHLLNRGQVHTKFVALETNPRLFAYLTARWGPSVFVHRSAEELGEALRERGIERVEAIVSGLPWASLDPELQSSILHEISACLAPGGVFVTFAYLQGLLLPGGARIRKLLHQQFASVERTKVVWNNVPPALVYVCRKQRGGSSERSRW